MTQRLYRPNEVQHCAAHVCCAFVYQLFIHHVAPVDAGLALGADQVVDVAVLLFQLHHSVTQLLHAEYTETRTGNRGSR